VLNCFVFSHKTSINEGHQQSKKQITEVKLAASQEKSGICSCASDVEFTDTQWNSDLAVADTRCSVKVCMPKASGGSSDLASLDQVRVLSSGRTELDSRRTAADQLVQSSDDVPLCYSCRAIEQQFAVRAGRPRSLEVTSDFKVNIQSHQYENLEHIFRNTARAASGSHLNISDGRNKKDTEEIGSRSSSSATVTTPVGRVTTSASVDAAIVRTVSAFEYNDIDRISRRFVYNSVKLDSAAKNRDGIPSISSEHCFRENKGAKKSSNWTAHCSRHSGEVSLLNEELLKHCSRKPRSVSMPIDIVSAQRLPPGQRVGHSPLTLTARTTPAGHNQEQQSLCSGCSMPPAEDTKADRRRAYRVGLNLFNR